MLQTDLRQTGIAIIKRDKKECKVPLFTSNLLEESFKLANMNSGYKVIKIFAFNTIEKLKEYNSGVTGKVLNITKGISCSHGTNMSYFI